MSSNKPEYKVFLIGMMGSGKSYWAQRLAKKLKVTTYDLDHLVEVMEERSITEIFEQSGEEHFRKEEAKMLRMFGEKKQFVLSCGGGTPCFFDNMKWMNNHGITIWVDEPVEVLTSRLLPEKDKRPLLKNMGQEALGCFLKDKLNERLPFYTLSQHRLQSVNITESNLLNLIKTHV